MRYVTAIILLIGMLGTTFSNYCVWLDYALNKKYIAANLCENRSRPELKCEGKCYLCKKIKKENNKDSENSAPRINFKFQLLSTLQTESFIFSIPNIARTVWPSYQERPCSSFSPSIFHPPQA
jgi:hypothetical protein